tara:strand:+ start:518 stop:766 length:249 start_codon:yes stop_codon:yes gene_type:complete
MAQLLANNEPEGNQDSFTCYVKEMPCYCDVTWSTTFGFGASLHDDCGGQGGRSVWKPCRTFLEFKIILTQNNFSDCVILQYG